MGPKKLTLLDMAKAKNEKEQLEKTQISKPSIFEFSDEKNNFYKKVQSKTALNENKTNETKKPMSSNQEQNVDPQKTKPEQNLDNFQKDATKDKSLGQKNPNEKLNENQTSEKKESNPDVEIRQKPKESESKNEKLKIDEPKAEDKKKSGFFSFFKGDDNDEKIKEEKEEKEAEEKERKEREEKKGEEDKKKSEKKGGFFSGIFGNDDEKPTKKKENEKDKIDIEENKKEPEKKNSFFSGIFGDDEKTKKEKETEKVKKDSKGFFSNIFGKDDDEKKENNELLEHEETSEIDKNEQENDEDEVTEEIKEIKKPATKRKVRQKLAENKDLPDLFVGGEGRLMLFLDKPHNRTLVLSPHLDSRYGHVLRNSERILGITPGKFKGGDVEADFMEKNRARGIYVQSLIPKGPALYHGVSIGDYIVAIEDEKVNSNNYNEVVKKVENNFKVKLTLQKVLLQFDSSLNRKRSLKPTIDSVDDNFHAAIVTKITGQSLTLDSPCLPHGMLYLRTNISSDEMHEHDAKEDVVYEYMRGSSEKEVGNARGLFITIQSLLKFTSKHDVTLSTILLKNVKVNVAYHSVENHLLVLYLPDICCMPSQTVVLLKSLVEVLKLQFGSVEKSFENTENFMELNNLCACLFQKLILPCQQDWNTKIHELTFNQPFYQSLFFCIKTVIVDSETKTSIDECLSDFEAGDFGIRSETYYGCRRIFHICGSAFYYKDYLISNHLPDHMILPVNTLLHIYNFFNSSNIHQLSQKHFWREIYLSRNNDKKQISGKYRHFVLAFSSHNSVMVAVLEANEESSKAIGLHPPYDLLLLNQLQFSLSQLVYFGILEKLEHSFTSGAKPLLATLDWFMKKEKNALKKNVIGVGSKIKNFFKNKKKQVSQDSSEPLNFTASQENVRESMRKSIRRRMPDSTFYLKSHFEEGSLSEADYEEIYQEQVEDIFNQHNDKLHIGNFTSESNLSNLITQPKKYLHDKSDFEGFYQNQSYTLSPYPLIKLTTNCNNTLFNYAFIDHQNHLCIVPSLQQLISTTSLSHYEVIENFQKYSCSIHTIFCDAQKNSSRELFEYGVLFNCRGIDFKNDEQKLAKLQSTYWIIGRLVKIGSDYVEFFACFHDSAQQHMIDMAFKLIQGSYVV